ncbi:MAG: DivIVA domain protein [Modestobacter sp.]|nr:DivIVA domain protein [Modestobacter sp.]MCW2574052.1 DivIVA domain protein [Modestobacter sp.]
MTTEQQAFDGQRGDPRLTPEVVRSLQFPRAGMLHPGYEDAEVDRFRDRVAEELTRLGTEKAELDAEVRDLQAHLRSLEEQLRAVVPPEPPSDEAVRILIVAQQTADQYVSEAEDFSRQMTTDARAQYEEQLRSARENAGAIIQAAHEAASRMVTGGSDATPQPGDDQLSAEQLQEEVAYLKAFGQAVRVQLRSYLEALITDVESEWGHAHPAALPQEPIRTRVQRSDAGTAAGKPGPLDVAAEVPPDDGGEPGPAGGGGIEVSRAQR